MSSRSKYKTKQREILIRYFETVPGVHVTANDVCEHFKNNGIAIGQSTVYRQIENLVDEGILQKYNIDSNSPACFEYLQNRQEETGCTCFHCKCEKCGRVIHLHCEEIVALQEHLFEKHHFKPDPIRTVFYGLCQECQKEADSPEEDPLS